MTPLAVTAYTATTAVGVGTAALAAALRDGRGGLRPNDFTQAPLATYIGRVDGVETLEWPAAFAAWECRNNRLAWLGAGADGFAAAVAAARRRHGAARIALVVGTSTSSIGASEEAYARLGPDGRFPPDLDRPVVHQPHSLGVFLAEALGLDGPCVTVSTACSSSAKVFAYAERLIRLGLVDAAVVGGVDTLCGSVLFGFHSLALTSGEPCRPFDVTRSGISIGEAAGFALLERDGDAQAWFIGHGESSDAHHMSSPHPEGLGARLALEAALERAGLVPAAVDYINLHGTASQKNDEIEAAVVAAMFPPGVAASSTKGWTGHTLGAAGVVEAVICLLAIRDGFRPGTLNSSKLDPACGPQIRIAGAHAPVAVALTESFGFGGNNCVLAFAGRRP
ncbi:MAG: beta-ketoacyl-ACP synthase [Proteobacteria bacterium]|nr:beta-ketoacyl-ACP synthase [Pseudomonadota bacterium]